MSTVFYDCPLGIRSPISGVIPRKKKQILPLWAASVACLPLWVWAGEMSPTDTLAYQLVLSYAGLVEATIFLRFRGCSFTVIPKRQYSAVGLLVIWLLQSFCPHFHDFPWDLDVGVMLGYISWACGNLSFSICGLAVGLYHSLWPLQKKKKFLCWWVKVAPICGYKDKYFQYD